MWVVGCAVSELYSDIYEVVSVVSSYLGLSIWQLQIALFLDEIRWIFIVIKLCAQLLLSLFVTTYVESKYVQYL